MDNLPQNQPKRYTRRDWLQFGLFWSWNLIFLAFMSFGFAPIMLPETFTAVRTGLIPASYLLYALVLALVPVAAVILGLASLRRSPSRLFALGYVIEGPLMLLLALRFFAIRQATLGITLLLGLALLGMAAFLWRLLDPRADARSPVTEALRLVGLTLMAVTSLYAAAWIAFYALPLGVEAGRGLINLISNLPKVLADLSTGLWELLTERPLMLPFSVLGFILLLYTGTLFVLTPVAVPLLSVRAWRRSLGRLSERIGWGRPALLVGLTVAACAGLFTLANRQPQAQAFALLEEPPASVAEAQALLERAEDIRAGLLNAYLAPFRYISAEGEVRHVSEIYTGTFNLPRRQAFTVQSMYESLARPMLYKPVHRPDPNNPVDNRALVQEPREAARLYQAFFDVPITEAERPLIVRAVRSTWSPDQAEAAWQAIDDREVHLVRQQLSLREQGDWAEVELYEVYQNQTAERQEVIYYFNLPESAVLTGVWLGNSEDKSRAFDFHVAPRGAAQAVYREETRRAVDPALLEQIGPRQYRLRIFPIPPMRVTFDEKRSRSLYQEAPQLHMWLAWRTLAEGDAWPLPQLAFSRNVYWDAASERLANDQPLEAGDEWLPKSLPASGPVQPQTHRVDLPGGQTALAIPAGLVDLPELPAGLSLAVVLDRSRSMQAHAEEVIEILQQLKGTEGLEAPVDVYLTASPYRGEEPSVVSLETLDPQEVLYFGGQNSAQLVKQFDTLQQTSRSQRQYQAVMVITDGSGYELGDSKVQLLVPDAPIWVVHVGGEMPLGYDDQTLKAIQSSGGGVASSLEEAMERIAVSLDKSSGVGTDLLDGYLWRVLPAGEAAAALPRGVPIIEHGAGDPFAALAARRLTLAEMQRQRGTIDDLATLDALHALAMEYQIVTPYSSMIVLVNAQQEYLLDKLSEQGDRYQREFEALSETTPGSPLPLAGVPEPHEWLLLALAAALLVYLMIKRSEWSLRPVR